MASSKPCPVLIASFLLYRTFWSWGREEGKQCNNALVSYSHYTVRVKFYTDYTVAFAKQPIGLLASSIVLLNAYAWFSDTDIGL